MSRLTIVPQRNEILSTSYCSSLSLLLLSPVLSLRHCHYLRIPVSPSPISLLSHILAAAIVCNPSPPLNLYAVPILSGISTASVVIQPHLQCGPLHIIFHCPASFNAVIFICVSYVSLSNSSFSSPSFTTDPPPTPPPLPPLDQTPPQPLYCRVIIHT